MDYQHILNMCFIAIGFTLLLNDFLQRQRIDLWRDECINLRKHIDAIKYINSVNRTITNERIDVLEGHLFGIDKTEDTQPKQ